MTSLARLLAAALLGLLAGCASEATSGPSVGSDVTDKKPSDTNPDPSDPAHDASSPSTTATAPSTGLVVIDLQKAFFDVARDNPKIDGAVIQANTIKLMKAAGDQHRPVLVTYEASTSGDHAMPAALKSAEPSGTKELIKTTFGAMGLPAFASAVRDSGVKRWVVVGAETDVCVLQTMMGLRKAGLNVVAASDALMTEEENAAPARRRMAQAGVVSLTTDEAVAVLAGGPAADAPAGAQVKILSPLETGIVLNDVAGIAGADPSSAAKKARLHELFLLTEWFKLPVMAADPTAATNALPADLKSLLTKPIIALANRPPTVKNVAVAGGSKDLASAVSGLGSDVWIVSDAIVGSDDFESLYASGAVPSTYKSLYYELTVSVDDRGWPSQQWVQDGIAKYWDLTKAPEDLPPLSLK
jgi:nicotinamidase-related amidase